MLFTPDNANKVIEGRKTQTRRICGDREYPIYFSEASNKIWAVRDAANHRMKWQVGQIYAVQPGRGKVGIGLIKITAIRQERLQDISRDDAKAEGVSNVWEWSPERNKQTPHLFKRGVLNPYIANFSVLWDSINTKRNGWDANPCVWVIEFEIGKVILADSESDMISRDQMPWFRENMK